MVISEIMYKPAPRNDGKNLEYIELFNSNPFFFDMSGWQLSGAINFTFPSPMIVPGGSFVVIAAAPADVQTVYGLSSFLGPYTGSLKNSGTIQLLDEVGSIRLEISDYGTDQWPAA